MSSPATVMRLSSAAVLSIGQTLALAVVAVPLSFTAPAEAQQNCLTINHLAGSGYTQFRNYCGTRINVRWRDQRYCASGCMDTVSPNGGVQNATLWVGSTDYCVCWNYDRCCDL